jgi:hypothetical protein
VKGVARSGDEVQAALLRYYARTVLARAPSRSAEIKIGDDALAVEAL